MFGFLQDPDYVSGVTPIPATTAFITITVSGPEAKLSAPGDKDKQIAVELAGIFEGKSYHLEEEDKMDEAVSNAKLAKEYLNLAANMTQNGRPRGIPSWWYPLTTPPTTTPIESDVKYECDAQLGSPAPNDCTYIQSQDLGPDSDTIEIKPGAVIFLHQNTCNTAITSSIDLILTWEQVRVALAALVAACVLQPSKWSHGGRAFYEPHPVKRRRGHDRKRDPSLLNALPPHANITLFQQKEAWRGPSVEQDSCTWKAVMRGVSITTCSAT
ncbi:hypothetical protein MMC14_007269 [Varicellaria rhodocarpa]|nr:hypothetical protein [Varicellaria rhodocarpa]